MNLHMAPYLLRDDNTESKRNEIKNFLGNLLKTRSLTVFVGAGISKSTGSFFPSWPEIVDRCCNKSSVPFEGSKSESTDYLLERAERVEDECRSSGKNYAELLKQSLYENVEPYSTTTLKNDVLIALGSLAMNSVRGAARAIVTYNFDDLLEWYLEYHGFRICIVSKFPPPEPVAEADVVIYHPHGFLPRQNKYSHLTSKDHEIVFSKRSYENANSKATPWNELQKALFGTSVALILGMSGDDPHINVLHGNTYDDLGKQRLVGFIVLKDSDDNKSKVASLENRGIIATFISDYPDLPEFMLEICRLAACL